MVGCGSCRSRSLRGFLQQHHPALAGIVAREILAKAQMLERHPELGFPIGQRGRYRQVVLEVLRAKYIFRYGSRAIGS
jgi:hypothetical protein